jgi:hypothetical protein
MGAIEFADLRIGCGITNLGLTLYLGLTLLDEGRDIDNGAGLDGDGLNEASLGGTRLSSSVRRRSDGGRLESTS